MLLLPVGRQPHRWPCQHWPWRMRNSTIKGLLGLTHNREVDLGLSAAQLVLHHQCVAATVLLPCSQDGELAAALTVLHPDVLALLDLWAQPPPPATAAVPCLPAYHHASQHAGHRPTSEIVSPS
ncbi:rCG52747 [Rattus norvegicus]|uniref:RCG52747 n=1 Tax=Rattus norvegicus TaxID=10116 RepID=A6IRI0_RAT|nr:rCG52747 [Rattus norvegicus]